MGNRPRRPHAAAAREDGAGGAAREETGCMIGATRTRAMRPGWPRAAVRARRGIGCHRAHTRAAASGGRGGAWRISCPADRHARTEVTHRGVTHQGAPQTGAPQTGAPQTGVPHAGLPHTAVTHAAVARARELRCGPEAMSGQPPAAQQPQSDQAGHNQREGARYRRARWGGGLEDRLERRVRAGG